MSLEFRKLRDGRKLLPWLRDLANRSGCYIIREFNDSPIPTVLHEPEILYIGESHTNRLRTTLLRHFQHWKGKTAGVTFSPSTVEIAVIRCPADKALTTQNALIEQFRPKFNVVGNPDAADD